MNLLKTDKTTFTDEDILKYIEDYERDVVPVYTQMWEYYLGKNTKIMNRLADDPNAPNNKVPVPYGRKLIDTFKGYAYRPRYISYKQKDDVKGIDGYLKQLMKTFDLNEEHIKTSKAGRNTGIFGVAYEILYIDKEFDAKMTVKAEPHFYPVDPREMILLYDYQAEPQKVAGIRFYKVSEELYKVEVYYPGNITLYDRVKNSQSTKWELRETSKSPNMFGEIPIVAYYFGDEMQGIIEPVIHLIDAYDALITDAMDENEKFANAFLVLKQVSITDPTKVKTPGTYSKALANLKRFRVFENIAKDAEISYLTKDIPVDFFKYMTELIHDEIHIQSHIPDYAERATGDLSGAAMDRLMFDFETLVSSAEADFDVGLYDRIRLITTLYKKAGRVVGEPHDISIAHKRNKTTDVKGMADTALVMKNAGFSRYVIVDIMPDEVIPDVDAELKRQDEEREAMMPDIDEAGEEEVAEEGNPIKKDEEEPA